VAPQKPEYVLGTSEAELERLRFQQVVWKGVTDAFFDRLGVGRGWRCLDAGCGPGFVAEVLRERVGEEGRVVAVDASPRWVEALAARAHARGWKNLEGVVSTLEAYEAAPGEFDLVFLRWVLSFVADPRAVVSRLARALRAGGLLAVEDYNHEGVSIFPESAAFRRVIDATRRLYASRGGDPWIATRLPSIFRAAGLELVEFTPTVLCGGPGSDVFRWAEIFFVPHTETMVREGLLTVAEREAFLREWEERRRDPGALFFSPIVVDAAGKRGEHAYPVDSEEPHR
jgi:ubiquinone/menaquinone biosynthesis C-methylase UbiE